MLYVMIRIFVKFGFSKEKKSFSKQCIKCCEYMHKLSEITRSNNSCKSISLRHESDHRHSKSVLHFQDDPIIM